MKQREYTVHLRKLGVFCYCYSSIKYEFRSFYIVAELKFGKKIKNQSISLHSGIIYFLNRLYRLLYMILNMIRYLQPEKKDTDIDFDSVCISSSHIIESILNVHHECYEQGRIYTGGSGGTCPQQNFQYKYVVL